ncbi:hypothetical protein [Streptomyces sp. NPDC004050]
MRSALIALRAGGLATALAAFTAVAGPAASAPTAYFAGEEDRGGVSVDPHRAEPGAQVKLRVHGCDARWATARSSVFVAEAHLSSGPDGDGTLRGDTMISSRAEPGRYDVRVRCDGSELRGSLEVGRRGGQAQGKESAKDSGKDSGKDPGKGLGRDPDRDSSRERGEDSARGRGEDSTGGRGEDSGKEHDKESARERDEDSAKERDGDSSKEHGQVDPDEGRERPDPHESPIRPVHAGGGGMAAELAETARIAERAKQAGGAGTADAAGGTDGAGADAARTAAVAAKKNHGADGPGLPHTVVGAVLAAAATLAVAGRALTLRRRRSGE